MSSLDVGEVSVPATLQAIIAARIDRLDPAAKRTLCAAAVIGMKFDTELRASIEVEAVLEELLRAELGYFIGIRQPICGLNGADNTL